MKSREMLAASVLLFFAAPAMAEDKAWRASLAFRMEYQGDPGLMAGVDRTLWVPHRWLRVRAGAQLSCTLPFSASVRGLPDAQGMPQEMADMTNVDVRLLGVGELSVGAEHARVQLGLLFLLGPQFYSREEHVRVVHLGIQEHYQHSEVVWRSGMGLTLRGRITPHWGAQLGVVYDVLDFSRSYAQLGVSYAF